MHTQNTEAPEIDSDLDLDSAASAIEGLLSGDDDPEDTRARETPPESDASPADDEDPSETDQSEQADEEEESQSDEEQDDEQNPQPRTFRVKVDGEELEVTEDELIKGYSRTADYTRKTQKHSEQVKAFEAEASALRQQYSTHITQLRAALESLQPQEPDWDKLRQENPTEFAAQWAAWDQHQKQLELVRAEEMRVQAEQTAQQQRQMAQYIEAERAKLPELIPEWKDEAVAKKDRADLVEFAKGLGYTESDLSQVFDARVVKLLRMAMLYDRAQKQKPTIREKIERVRRATPGPATSRRPQANEAQRRAQRLVKSGSIDDAASVLELMIDD